MESFIKLIDVMAWPVTLLVLFWLGREPLKNIFPFVDKIKYKDVEINFRQQLELVKNDLGEGALKKSNSKDQNELYKLIEISPQSAIIESWKKAEIAAREKINQLLSDETKRTQALRRPLDYLEYEGTHFHQQSEPFGK